MVDLNIISIKLSYDNEKENYKDEENKVCIAKVDSSKLSDTNDSSYFGTIKIEGDEPKNNSQNIIYNGYLNLSDSLSREGLGRYDYSNGDTYFGEWKGDLKHGYGIYTNKEDNKIFCGLFDKGNKLKGIEIIDGGYLYAFIGNFKDNKFHNGLYLSNPCKNKIEDNISSNYIYLGNFTSKGKKTDDKCFMYDKDKKFYFYGKIENDIAKCGFQLNEDLTKIIEFYLNEKNEVSVINLAESNLAKFEDVINEAKKFQTITIEDWEEKFRFIKESCLYLVFKDYIHNSHKDIINYKNKLTKDIEELLQLMKICNLQLKL